MSLREADRGFHARENQTFLKKIENALRRGGIVSPGIEAERLALHFSKMSRVDFFTGQKAVLISQKKRIAGALKRRLSGVPSAYLTGIAGFYGHDFYVNPHTLIPRPETELLIEETLRIPAFAGMTAPKILEIGTGSGCVAVSLTIARPDCRMTALEVSYDALKTARKNARFHGVGRRISFFQSDLFEVFGQKHRAFWDVLVSNPPYIPKGELRQLPREVRREPRLALDGGAKGLQVLEAILKKAPYYLKRGGFVVMEIGKGQSRAIARTAARLKFYKELKFVKDYAGIDRILVARTNG